MYKIDDIIPILLYLIPGFIALRVCSLNDLQSWEKKHSLEIFLSSILHSFMILFLSSLVLPRLSDCFSSISECTEHFSPLSPTSFDWWTIPVIFSVSILHGLLLVLFNLIQTKLEWKKPGTIWPVVNHLAVDQPNTYAIVFLENGRIYSGQINSFSNNPRREEQDFLLEDARKMNEDKDTGTLSEEYKIKGLGVYLNTREVKCIEYLNLDEDAEIEEPTSE